ncbi:MAG: hypothetical protein ACXVHS_07670, partial [Methanobacterium sp.]
NLTNYNFHNIYNIANINYNNSIWDESTIRTEMELKSGDWRHYDSEYAKYSDSSFARLQPFFEIEKQLLTITQNEFFFPLYFSTTLHNEVDLDYDLSMPVGWC